VPPWCWFHTVSFLLSHGQSNDCLGSAGGWILPSGLGRVHAGLCALFCGQRVSEDPEEGMRIKTRAALLLRRPCSWILINSSLRPCATGFECPVTWELNIQKAFAFSQPDERTSAGVINIHEPSLRYSALGLFVCSESGKLLRGSKCCFAVLSVDWGVCVSWWCFHTLFMCIWEHDLLLSHTWNYLNMEDKVMFSCNEIKHGLLASAAT